MPKPGRPHSDKWIAYYRVSRIARATAGSGLMRSASSLMTTSMAATGHLQRSSRRSRAASAVIGSGGLSQFSHHWACLRASRWRWTTIGRGRSLDVLLLVASLQEQHGQNSGVPNVGCPMEKDYLILKPASASRSSGEWNDDDFDVFPNGEVVGRIFKANAAPVGESWMWTLAFGHHEDRTPTHGCAATREATRRRSPRAGGANERKPRMSRAVCTPTKAPGDGPAKPCNFNFARPAYAGRFPSGRLLLEAPTQPGLPLCSASYRLSKQLPYDNWATLPH
jgi:hypothetical protein